MQFWRDALKTIFEVVLYFHISRSQRVSFQNSLTPPPQHPIAIALVDASKTAHIVPYHLKRIVDARVSDLGCCQAYEVLYISPHRKRI